MTKLQQTAACPVCFDGLQEGPDQHDYQANWNYWHEHSRSLEQDTAPWVSWQKKEPLVTHEVTGSDTMTKHWLCRGCVYRHNPASGQFSILNCPVCRHVLDIPGRVAGSVAHLQEYASEDVQDNFHFDDDRSIKARTTAHIKGVHHGIQQRRERRQDEVAANSGVSCLS